MEILEVSYKKPESKIGYCFADVEHLLDRYIYNVVAYCLKEGEPDEYLMGWVEDGADIGEQYADDFRRQIMAYIGCKAARGEQVAWDFNLSLTKGLKKVMRESRGTN